MKKLSFFLMAMLFTCATTLQAAEVTETIAMKGFGGLTTSSYENVTKTGTSDLGTEMVAYAFNPKTGQIRGNKTAIAGASITTKDDSKNWSLYNTQAMPGAIKKITVTQTANGSNKFQNSMYVALGTTNQGAVTTVTGAQTNTTGTATEFTFNIDETQGYTYFKLLSNVKFTSGSVAGAVVTVTYVTAEGGEEEVTKYTVTANVNDPAMGAVSGAGEYAEGKTATLTANANPGYKFVNWSNGSTDNPLKITVTEDIEITANFEAVPPMTCAEAAATADGTTVVLKPFDVVAVVKDAGYIYIEDESGVNLIYDYNLAKELKAGDHVEGFVGYSSPYNGLPELKPSVAFADLTVTPGTAPEPTLFTEVPTKADLNKYVKFENVTFTANATFTTSSATNATMVVNGTNVTLRNTFKLAATLEADKAYDIVGFVAIYNSTIQVYFLSAEEYVAPVVTHDFYVENVTVTEGQWSIDLSGSWNEQAFVLKLWQDNTQGFGTYAANAETGYSASLGVKELTPTAEGYFMQDPMNENAFIFQGTMTDGTDIYEVYLKGTIASTETGEMEAKNDVSFSCDADGAWTIEAYADDMTWGLYLEVAQDPETMEWIATGYYITDLEASIREEVQGIGMLYFDDLTGRQVFSATLTTSREQEIYPTLYASSLTLMTNDLMTGESWMGQLNSTSCFEVLLYAADYSWELDLHASNCTGADGTYTIEVIDEAEGAYSTFMGNTIVTGELTIEDGMYDAYVTTVDSEGNPAMSISVLAWAAAAEEYDIVITDATVTDNTSGYNIDLTGEWEGHTIKVEVCDELTAETILANFFIDGGIANDGDQAEGTVEATVSEGVVTITGTFECLGSGNVYNVTISGTLPVAEPETITWELNGGEVAAVVPTNEELWKAFKPYYNTFYSENRADQAIADVATFMTKGEKIFTDATSEYKWLGDYLVKIATEQGYTINSEALWRWHADAFFNCNQHTLWPKSADFTEAGKPENWGPAYQAAHEVVLPTEPVEEDYVLPTPTKSGSTFKGWYDNAEGTGEAYTVIPAGWAGTLYAIWEQGTTTALENIAVEGKAVKAIVNGQLIIIKNGVQYNAQGQVIK